MKERDTQVTLSQLMLEKTWRMGCCTPRILAVGAAAADPRSCWWRWGCCCCCCVPARLGVEHKQGLKLSKKPTVPVSGGKSKHRSGIRSIYQYIYEDANMLACTIRVLPNTQQPSASMRHAWDRPLPPHTHAHGAHAQRIHAYIMTTHALQRSPHA